VGYFGGYFGTGSGGGSAIPTIADGPTTFETIRDAQFAVIEALTPTKLAGRPFQRHRESKAFMAWVEANPTRCLRRVQILSSLEIETAETSDGFMQHWQHTEDVRVAYPLEMGIYGAENERDMEDLIELDLRSINGAIGRHGIFNYVAGQQVCEFQRSSLEEVDGGDKGKARVLSMVFLVRYDRSV
jgi:hypothetical protein